MCSNVAGCDFSSLAGLASRAAEAELPFGPEGLRPSAEEARQLDRRYSKS